MPSPEQEGMEALSEAILRLLRRHDDLDRRLRRIEQRLGLEDRPATAAAPESQPAGLPSPKPPESAAPPPPPASMPRAFEARMGLTWINRAGVVTLVLGVAFFFKYAVDNQWIGQRARVILGTLTGAGALGLAEWLWRASHHTYAQGITAAGVAILYVSVYAAFGFYRLIPNSLAFSLMALNTAAAGWLAVRYRGMVIAGLGLAGGYATPLLLSTDQDRPWVLFSYVLLLDLGAVAVARVRRWHGLEVLAFLATVFLYLYWFDTQFDVTDRAVATWAALAFFAVFATRNLRPVWAAAQCLAAAAIAAIWAPEISPFVLLALVLFLAGLAAADQRGWPEAALVTLGSFWAATLGWYAALPEPRPVTTVFLFFTAGFLFFHAWTPWRVLLRGATCSRADYVALALNAAVYFSACYHLLRGHHRYVGAFAFALAALHLASARELWREQSGKRDPRPALLSVGVGVALMTAAVPMQFLGYRNTMAWALEALALVWVGVRTRATLLVRAGLVVFALALVRLYFFDAALFLSLLVYATLFNLRFLTFLTVAATLFAAAWWIRRGWPALATYVAGHAVMLWALGLEVSGWAGRHASPENLRSVRGALLSILIAVYAVVLVGAGISRREAVNRVLGLVLIAAVVAKLYLYDVWLLGRIYRVTAFAALGVLLLVASYLYSRYRGPQSGKTGS